MKLLEELNSKRNISSLFVLLSNAASLTVLMGLCYSMWLKAITVGGPDFLYSILYGRDLSLSKTHASYGYFPGVQKFWSFCISIVGADINILQRAYVIVLLLSVLVFVLNMFQITRNIIASVVFGWFYVALLFILEGMGGVLEPFSILLVMTGYLLYQCTFLKKYYHLNAVVMIVFLAMTAFTKQQSLVFVVASFLLPYQKIKFLHEVKIKNLLVPFGSILVFYVFFLIDGEGLNGILVRLNEIKTYTKHGSFLFNLQNVFKAMSPVLYIYFILSLLTVKALWSHDAFQKYAIDIRRIAFWLVSGVGFLYQFTARGYLHYGIYFIPCILFPLAIQWRMITDWLTLKYTKRLACQVMPFVLLVISVVTIGKWSVFRQSFDNSSVPKIVTEIDEVSGACRFLIAERVLLLPPRGNAFHWACGTIPFDSHFGYSWIEESADYYRKLLKKSEAKDVFLFDVSFGPFERELLTRADWKNISSELEKEGFTLTFENKAGKLYQRQQ